MHAAAPRGFLGRSFTGRHTDLGLPEDASNWSDHHILIALSRRGEDLPGNLVIGREFLLTRRLPAAFSEILLSTSPILQSIRCRYGIRLEFSRKSSGVAQASNS